MLVPSLTQDFCSALSITVDFNETTPGEVWRCEVTVRDNEDADGPPAVSANVTILEGGATPSFISLGVSPTQVTLGQSLTASGQIFPTPLGTETVTFTSVDPDGVEVGNFPNGASTPNGIYSKTFFPTQATTGRAVTERMMK